jgi:hypothetical protein
MPRGVTGFVDLYAGHTIPGRWVTIEATRSDATGQLYPAGRVYLYAR